jgi:hypothetical protein
MHVTRHSAIADPTLIDRLWSLYVRAYMPVAEETVTHEMLHRVEFAEQLRSSVNRVWVVWDAELPVAMTVISTDVRSTRWLSEQYFAKHFPDRFVAGQVHYVVWAVVDPDYGARGAVIHLGKHCLAVEAEEGALLVFDTPEANQPKDAGGSAELLLRLARMVSDAELVPISVQRYYAISFPAPSRYRDGADVEHVLQRPVG